MYANCEMNMPKRYVELSEDEMEYDGGFGFLAGLVCSAISLTCTAIAITTNNQTIAQAATVIGLACTAVSIVTGTGIILKAAEAAWKVETSVLASAAYAGAVTPVESAFTFAVTGATWPF